MNPGPSTLSPSKGHPSHPFASLPRSDYRVILADPPWAFRTFNAAGRTPTSKKFAPVAERSGAETSSFRQAEDHYPTMPFAEMANLPVASVCARDALLAMWIVGSHCDEALDLARAWGFSFVTDLFYWLKQNRDDAGHDDLFLGPRADRLRISMGYHTRKQVEPCWLFKRGKGCPALAHDVRQVILAAPRQHSRKPPEQYDRLHRLYGAGTPEIPSLELFSRTPAKGWDAWGNEVGKFEPEGVEA